MAGTTLDAIPPAISLNGNELVWLYQHGNDVTPWIGVSCTVGLLASFFAGINSVTPSMRQLFAAMANQGVMVTAFEQLPADITDPDNIAWNHAFRMSLTDTFTTGFLQPAIGYSDLQMIELFALALTFPA